MVTEANYTIYSGVRSATRHDEGTTDVYVLHRVLYPQVHDNGVKKTKKRYNRLKERYVVFRKVFDTTRSWSAACRYCTLNHDYEAFFDGGRSSRP
jgi:hypothetical protein